MAMLDCTVTVPSEPPPKEQKAPSSFSPKTMGSILFCGNPPEKSYGRTCKEHRRNRKETTQKTRKTVWEKEKP
jgi:hypothetical protein